MYTSPTFRPGLPSIVAATWALSCLGCEVVLGADFDDFTRVVADDGRTYDPDASSGGADGRDGPTVVGRGARAGTGGASGGSVGTGGAAGGAGMGIGGANAGGPSTGGKSGTGGVGGRVDTGGSAGSPPTVDASRPGVPPVDASVRDALSDASATHDIASRDAADAGTAIDAATELTPPPSQDGGTGGGSCIPNEVRSIAICGNCGLLLQVCNAQGAWDAPFCREEPGACVPGSTERRACPSGGTQLATCNASCTWSLGECIQPPCIVGQTEVLPCSLCGTQTRTCQATEGSAEWGPFSACANQGVCAASTTDVTSCGKCGKHSRVCNAMCAWDPWGVCEGEGECVPGTTESRNCTILIILVLGKQTRTCEASCTWGAYGDCR